LEDPELVEVCQLCTTEDICNRLAEEYGTVSDLNYARAEAALRSPLKLPTIAMKNHIDIFTRLKETSQQPQTSAP